MRASRLNSSCGVATLCTHSPARSTECRCGDGRRAPTSPLPRLLLHLVGDQHIVNVRCLTFIAAHPHAAVGQQRRQIVIQRGVMHRQPAALIAQAIYRGFCRILRRIERNADGELAAHAGLGIYGDIAVHHADELLTNRQPQSGAPEVTLHAGTDTEERIEQANHLLRRNADPVSRTRMLR